MKAKQVSVSTTDEFLTRLDKMNRSAYIDPDICEIKVGDIGKPMANQMRPLGDIEHCRVHYLGNILDSPKDHNLPYYVVCVGRPNCPICAVADKLNEIGTDAAKEKARKFYSTERNYWNVLPRWDYDWDDAGKRFLVLSFGPLARGTLEETVADFGHPGSVDEGYDLIYFAEKKQGFGNNYSFKANLERTKKGTRVSQELVLSPLTSEEGEYDMVDLSKYVAEPSAEQFNTLTELFDIDEILGSDDKIKTRVSVPVPNTIKDDEEEEAPSAPKLRPRPSVASPVSEVDENELEEQEGKDAQPFCFADEEVHDPSETGCIECNYFDECAKEVKLKKINAIRNGS